MGHTKCLECKELTYMTCGFCVNCQQKGWQEKQYLDYLIDLALTTWDKLWFDKLVQEKRRLTND
jgi:hypothetical protein